MLLKRQPAKIQGAVAVIAPVQPLFAVRAAPQKGLLPLLALLAYTLLFLRDVFGGAARYYADIHGLSPLWFVPDAVAAFFVIIAIVRKAMRHEGTSAWLLPGAVIAYSILGFLLTQSTVPVVSAIKMILPLVFGFYAGEYGDRLTRSRMLHLAFWGITVAGVIASRDISFPWLNYQISTFGVARTATRQWWIQDVARLAGFATDSTGAGTIILVAGMFLFTRARSFLNLALLPPSLYALYLTTSRTSLFSFVVFIAVSLVARTEKSKIACAFFVAAAMVAIGSPLILPVIFGSLTYSDVPAAFTSFMDRVLHTWTNPWLYLIDQFPVGALVGAGLGPIGYPSLFAPQGQTPMSVVDNFALTNILMFGIPGLVGIVSLVKKSMKYLPTRDLIVGGVLLLFATTVEGYGNTVFCMAFGIVFSPWGRAYGK